MNNIKVAMTVNGELIEYGDRIRVIDKGGETHEGKFLKCHQHSFQPELMVIRYKRDDKEKHAVVGTNAELIEKVSDA